MTWELALQLALRFGPEWVDGLLKIIEEHGDPTPEAWAKVMALATKPYDAYINEAVLRAAIKAMVTAGKESPLPPDALIQPS